MKRHWRVRRQTHPCPDGQRRWNQAYHLLLEWTTPIELPTILSAPTVSLPDADQEDDDAHRALRSRVDPATGPPPDQ